MLRGTTRRPNCPSLLGRRALLGAAVAVPLVARAEVWPAKPIRVILPGPAGGLTDVAARSVAEAMQANLGQPWLIDPKPGANGIVGAQALLAELARRTEELNPDLIEPLLEELCAMLAADEIAPVQRRLDLFDFDGARTAALELAERLAGSAEGAA